jgi:hypothetical protein
MDGTLTAYGLGGEVLLSCGGPASKMCFLSPQGKLWYFRNHGPGLVRFVLVGVDAVDMPTIHEEIGQVVAIDGKKVTLALGDLQNSELAAPRSELTVLVAEEITAKVGDDVVTVRHDKKTGTTRTLIGLTTRWQ